MPRTARKKSSTGIYHVMLRGINKQTVFLDDEDNQKFLQTLEDCKKISGFELYAYCLMGNHIHLLLKIVTEELEQIFKRIGARYVYWYNNKYERSGHLFQGRYKSEAVEDDSYFAMVLRYIHQNPIKAGLCKSLTEYQWSSYNEYMQKSRIVNCKFALDLIGKEHFEKYMNEEHNDTCMDYSHRKRLTDKELHVAIENRYEIKASAIQFLSKDMIGDILKDILTIDGVSTRQLSRVTGISVNIIWKL